MVKTRSIVQWFFVILFSNFCIATSISPKNPPPLDNQSMTRNVVDVVRDLVTQFSDQENVEKKRTVVVVVTTSYINVQNAVDQAMKLQHTFLSFGPSNLLIKNRSIDQMEIETMTEKSHNLKEKYERNDQDHIKSSKNKELARNKRSYNDVFPHEDNLNARIMRSRPFQRGDNDKYLLSLLRLNFEDDKSREDLMNTLRKMQRKIRSKRVYALRNFDEYLAAASLYNFNKISHVPVEYLTGNAELDQANFDKLKKYHIYEPEIDKQSLNNNLNLNPAAS